MARKDFREIVLETWIPQVFTAILAAAAIVLGVPAVQDRYAEATASSQKKLEVYETISGAAVNYVHSVRQYRDYSEYSLVGLSDAEILDLKSKFQLTQNNATSSFNTLIRTIPVAFVFFGTDAQNELQEFETWAKQVQMLSPAEMPSTQEMITQLDQLIATLRAEVRL